MTWTEYHEQDDVESFLDYLSNTYDFVEVESIGESHEGRPMRVIKVCLPLSYLKPLVYCDPEKQYTKSWLLRYISYLLIYKTILSYF